MTHKRCINCKYRKSRDYQKDICKNSKFVKMDKDINGMIIKVHPLCEEIQPDYEVPCEDFSETLFFKILRLKDSIVCFYYRKRHPEWFV